jgi:NitT/TauT family transport system substrate-binding protein
MSLASGDAWSPADAARAGRDTTLPALQSAPRDRPGNQAPSDSSITSIAQQRGYFAAVGLYVKIPFPLMTAALKDHRVDAAWLPEPFLSSAEQQIGAQEIIDLDQGATADFPIVGYAVTRAWEQKYPRMAAAFLGALEKGQAVADSDRAAVERAAETFLGVPAQTAAVMTLPEFPHVREPELR